MLARAPAVAGGPFYFIRSNMFKYLVFFSAIGIALVAAYFSVTGIATLFAGKFFAIVAMASALEFAKLVAASFLYRNWKTMAFTLKTYLMVGVAVLMVITSIGIYGYLSAAYAEVAAVPQTILNQISFADMRQASLNETIARLESSNLTISTRQAQAQTSLDNVLSGQTDLSQRSAFANLRQEIADLDVERQANNGRIESSITERDNLENEKVTLNEELNTNSEIGTFIYIARILGLPLDTVVKWFVLIIVFVFDPMAISLILAYNSMVMKENYKDDEDPDDGEDPDDEEPIWIRDPKAHAEILRRAEEAYRKAKFKPINEVNVAPTRPPKPTPPSHEGFVEADNIINNDMEITKEAEYPVIAEQKEQSLPLYKARIVLRGSRYGQIVDVLSHKPNDQILCEYRGQRFILPKDSMVRLGPQPGWSLITGSEIPGGD